MLQNIQTLGSRDVVLAPCSRIVIAGEALKFLGDGTARANEYISG